MADATPAPFVLGPDALTDAEYGAVLSTALVAEADVSILEVTGPGAVQCIQGLLTNDIDTPGPGGFVYGAVLTTKGMIVSDLWAHREGGKVALAVPEQGKPAVATALQRFLPPRLAKAADRSANVAVLRLAGPRARTVAAAAGLAVPEPGRAGAAITGAAACEVARPEEDDAAFALQCTVQRDHAAHVRALLLEAGAVAGTTSALELARILAGWPRLDTEIDGKTLPQEVRFDEIGGVSYTKGCYTGQETVARVHFRGHPNRHLVGLVWSDPPDPEDATVQYDDRPRGRVTSLAWLAPHAQWVGLAVVRREVEVAQSVTAAGAPAEVVELPLTLPL